MIFRALDSSGDWTFGKGVNDYTTENGAIGLNIQTRVLSWLNDCFFDLTAGIDWTNRLGNLNQRQLLEDDLRRVISQSQDVVSINSIDVTVNTGDRSFRANYDINTIYTRSYIDSLEAAF